ncbi:MAG TPA: TIM44-like domain-containing protein [Rhodospirillaceae bacterium]|nr:TIM44-like domain-containing protein [Rhodospirillaceae bacterium]
MNDRSALFRFLPLLLSFLLVLMPAMAEAKLGKSATAGSRSSRSAIQPYGSTAKPLPPPVAAPPPAAVAPPIAAPVPRMAPPPPPPPPAPMGFMQRHPFLTGILGAGLGSMMFGGSFFGGGGGGGIFSLLLQLLLLGFLIRFVMGLFRRSADPGVPETPVYRTVAATPQAPMVPVEFALEPTDLAAFEQLLHDLQAAWSRGDLMALQRLATPEMAAFFGEQIREDRARGIENRVDQVHLIKGDVNETWREGPLDFATVSLNWSAADYTIRSDTGAVIEGDPRQLVETSEVWTFVRQRGGPWQMSAIQQLQ